MPPPLFTISEQKQVWHPVESGRWAYDCVLLQGNEDSIYLKDNEDCMAGECDLDLDLDYGRWLFDFICIYI